MTTVTFYILKNVTTRLELARWLMQWLAGETNLINYYALITDNVNETDLLDRHLWTLSANIVLPHIKLTEINAWSEDYPILIADLAQLPQLLNLSPSQSFTLINLSQQPLMLENQNIVELVYGDDATKTLLRQRYRHYQIHHCSLATKTIETT